jgi:hypothetical protein
MNTRSINTRLKKKELKATNARPVPVTSNNTPLRSLTLEPLSLEKKEKEKEKEKDSDKSYSPKYVAI